LAELVEHGLHTHYLSQALMVQGKSAKRAELFRKIAAIAIDLRGEGIPR